MKGISLKLITVFVAVLMSACAPTQYYTEQFSSIAVSDDKELVVLGHHYDYVFDMPDSIDNSLQSGFVDSLTCTLDWPIYIKAGGSTLAGVRLDLTDTATEAQIQEALDIGYTRSDEGLIFYTYSLVGQRVRSADVSQHRLIPLNQTFSFNVSDSQQAYEQMNMMSPVIIGAGTAAAVTTFPASMLMSLPVAGLRN